MYCVPIARTKVAMPAITGVIVNVFTVDRCYCKIQSRLREIVKQVSVDCTVIGVIEKQEDNRCFWKFPMKFFEANYTSSRPELA